MSRALLVIAAEFPAQRSRFLRDSITPALFIPFAARQVCRTTSSSMTSTNFCW